MKARPYSAWAKKLLIEDGFIVDDVERRNCWSGKKNDLFGFGDLFAVKGKRILIVQVTGPNDHNRRKNKILGLPVRGKVEDPIIPVRAKICLKSGIEIIVLSFRKLKGRWEPRVENLKVKDFT